MQLNLSLNPNAPPSQCFTQCYWLENLSWGFHLLDVTSWEVSAERWDRETRWVKEHGCVWAQL